MKHRDKPQNTHQPTTNLEGLRGGVDNLTRSAITIKDYTTPNPVPTNHIPNQIQHTQNQSENSLGQHLTTYTQPPT